MERRIGQVIDLAEKHSGSWLSCDDNTSHAIGRCPIPSSCSCNNNDEGDFILLRLAIRLAKRYHYVPILGLIVGTFIVGIIGGVFLAPMITQCIDRIVAVWVAAVGCSSTNEQQRRKLLFDDDLTALVQKEDSVRTDLLSNEESSPAQSIHIHNVPHHVAVIMDGNRRYGRATGTDGHWEGARKLLEFSQWCLEYKIQQATVFCFSTENWQRDQSEVASLLRLVTRYCAQELQEQAIQRRIRIQVQSTYRDPLPAETLAALAHLEAATDVEDPALTLHLCISYGSRSEIAQAADRIAKQEMTITEAALDAELLIHAPDIVIRTAGEVRLSNFLLWQAAYAELFFVKPTWPALTRRDFETVLEQYDSRHRKFGT